MIRRILKLSFFFTALVILALLITPLLFDKQKIVSLVNKKVNKEFNLVLKFDENIKVSLFPFPELTVKSVFVEDKEKNYSIKIPQMNVISTWRSIFKFDPEIQSIRLKAPVVKVQKNKVNGVDLIFVKNNQETKLNQIKSFLQKFKKILIDKGSIEFFYDDEIQKVENLDLQLTYSKSQFLKAEFNYINFKSLVKIDAKTNDFKIIKYKVNHSFLNKNEIIGSGKVEINNNVTFISGKFFSEVLNFFEIKQLLSRIKHRNRLNFKVSTNSQKLKFDLEFDLDRLTFNNNIFKKIKFKILSDDKGFTLNNLQANYFKSLLKGEATYDNFRQDIIGEVLLYDFLIDKSFSEKSKFGFDKALFDCEIKFLIKKRSNDLLDNTEAKGFCEADNVMLTGLDIEKISNGVDNIETFQDFFDLFNEKKMNGKTKIDSVNLNFGIKEALLKIELMEAIQKNVKVKSRGSYDIKKDKINLTNNIFIKTEKYKNLPGFDLMIRGSSDNYKISYDFDKIKTVVLSEGINSILKKKKKIIIDPKSFKKLIDKNSKEFNPEKIIDLFLN